MNINQNNLYTRIVRCIWIIIIGLALSGITAFPIEAELKIIVEQSNFYPAVLQVWLRTVYEALKATNQSYPYLSYGTDWLAFAHIMLAVLFAGTLKNPVKNKWVIEFGIIACIAILPLAFIAGAIRSIPLFWRLVDCSFGIIGIIPLLICYYNIKRLETLNNSGHNSTSYVYDAVSF